MDSKASEITMSLASLLNDSDYGTSSMTPAVYDTAWVSMITKEVYLGEIPGKKWLFPECFEYVLQEQTLEGGFGEGHTEVDRILNTMAALLAMCQHHANPLITGCGGLGHDLPARIELASSYLTQELSSWDVKSSVHVGFEVLVPGLLRMLRAEGHEFHFAASEELTALNQKKLSKFNIEMLYSRQRITALHSLEAFAGILDFDRVRLLHNGSMMGSPSATAAFLIYSSHWSDDAENYLRYVVTAGKGSVPSAFPISVFETSWVLSALLGSGFAIESLGVKQVSMLASFLEAQLDAESGITGFAPGMLPDADDTAKSLIALQLMGKRTSCRPLVEAFEAQTHFRTYSLETTASFSANCNVLLAILMSPDVLEYQSQINKAITFLCDSWNNGKIADKWNLEIQYSMMLLSECLSRTIDIWETNSKADIRVHETPLVSLQIAVRTLSSQDPNGSWKQSAEVTSYALLTLKRLQPLPWIHQVLGATIADSISRGTYFLLPIDTQNFAPNRIWVEKVSYGSTMLSNAYQLAAVNLDIPMREWSLRVKKLFPLDMKKLEFVSKFFRNLPLLVGEPMWRLKASILEAQMFTSSLKRAHSELDIFPDASQAPGKYLEYIPVSWTTCNNATASPLNNRVMVGMMLISVLNFQIDKWFELAAADSRLSNDFDALRRVAYGVFVDELSTEHNGDASQTGKNGHPVDRKALCSSSPSEFVACKNGFHKSPPKAAMLDEARGILSRFNHQVTSMTTDDSPKSIRRLHQDLCKFYQAHITQAEDSSIFMPSGPTSGLSAPDSAVLKRPRTSYYNWVHTTSAEHTSCPYSFQFFCLLAFPRKSEAFPNPRAIYFAEDVCSHLATMCRQYNDYGSYERDAVEYNLNSINFPEFVECLEWKSRRNYEKKDDSSRKLLRKHLREIADYERECLTAALERLKLEVSGSVWRSLRVFAAVTDLFGQIYSVKDINNDLQLGGDK